MRGPQQNGNGRYYEIRRADVNIDGREEPRRESATTPAASSTPGVLGGIAASATIFALDRKKWKESCAGLQRDGVGHKNSTSPCYCACHSPRRWATS